MGFAEPVTAMRVVHAGGSHMVTSAIFLLPSITFVSCTIEVIPGNLFVQVMDFQNMAVPSSVVASGLKIYPFFCELKQGFPP